MVLYNRWMMKVQCTPNSVMEMRSLDDDVMGVSKTRTVLYKSADFQIKIQQQQLASTQANNMIVRCGTRRRTQRWLLTLSQPKAVFALLMLLLVWWAPVAKW